jgi:hypothetical protein
MPRIGRDHLIPPVACWQTGMEPVETEMRPPVDGSETGLVRQDRQDGCNRWDAGGSTGAMSGSGLGPAWSAPAGKNARGSPFSGREIEPGPPAGRPGMPVDCLHLLIRPRWNRLARGTTSRTSRSNVEVSAELLAGDVGDLQRRFTTCWKRYDQSAARYRRQASEDHIHQWV